ncbi:MAG: hypothetical protein NTY19_10420 [Planctomycetota bacterium]|nr:hypothetical protein [Planctomycetota bacterium]
MSTTLLVDPPPVATAPPASRASWSGQLRLGSCCVPVKAYPTISSTAAVSLRQLHAGCGEHIEYHKCCPKHGRVPADQIAKGYPYSAEQCVALTEEDLATLEPTDDKTIHLEHFLSPTEFDLTLLAGRSLYLAPAHPAAMKPFVVIRQALLRADKWALGRTVFSSKRQLVIVYPAEEVLLVQTLFDPAQRRAAMPVDQDAVQIDRKEVDALTRWIESIDEPIRWQELRDDTDARLAQLVEAKLRGANGKASKRNGKPALTVARATPESKPSAPRRQRAAA